MSTSCMQAIKQQLEAMPLEEFEDLLKGVAVNKGHEGLPQHAELLSQLKHHVKVQPDEPIQNKASDKDWTFWKNLNQREKISHRVSSSGSGNINGNLSNNSHYNAHKHTTTTSSAPFGSSSGSKGSFLTGDQNANPVSSSCDTAYYQHQHQPVHNSAPGKYQDYNNHHHHSTLAFGNYVSSPDADPSRQSRRSRERDSHNDNTYTTSTKKNYCEADDDQSENEKSEEYTGTLPASYILPAVTKSNSKELPLQLFQSIQPNPQLQNSIGTSGPLMLDGSSSSSSSSLTQARPIHIDSPAPSSSSWDLQNQRHTPIQLPEAYKSVSSITSGAPTYMGRATSSSHDQVHGTIRAVSPTLPPSAIITKSPPLEASKFDKMARRGADRKKKSAKHVLRETVINPQEMPGYKGLQDIDKICAFVEGNEKNGKGKEAKPKGKEKKKDAKPRNNEKQVLSKAASLDENTLDYGLKKADDGSRNRNKEIDKKNATNVTKSTTSICSGGVAFPIPSTVDTTISKNDLQTKAVATPMVNGSLEGVPKAVNSNTEQESTPASKIEFPANIAKPLGTPKPQPVVELQQQQHPKSSQSALVSERALDLPSTPVPGKVTKSFPQKKYDVDGFGKDESDGPYVLVQSKKKKEKKKSQREQETFVRQRADQSRREAARARRGTERRKSVGSAPGSENSECSDDDDSVRSLPAGECTPRERIPKPCSSSGGTPQTSYADIARMSKDENGKMPATPVSLPAVVAKTPPPAKTSPGATVAVTSDNNFPALSPAAPNDKNSTAVWPCRPRPDAEPTKEVPCTPPAVSQEVISPKETSPVSEECSHTPDSKHGSQQNKLPSDVLTSADTILQSKLEETPNSTDLFKQPFNDSAGVAVSCVEPNVVPPPASKASQTKRLEEKKFKDKSVKGLEEFSAKVLSPKGLENGDVMQHPVVFCGGKFDSGQLSVGQSSGFEFGFGVIEALKDNVGSVSLKEDQNFSPLISGTIEMSTNFIGAGDLASSSEQIVRSHDSAPKQQHTVSQEASLLHLNDMNRAKRHPPPEEAVRQSAIKTGRRESPKVCSSPTELKQSVTQATTCISPTTPCDENKDVNHGTPPSAEHTAEVCIETKSSTGGDEKLRRKPLADIAQLFVPPVLASVPESIQVAVGYMDNYADKLSRLAKSGELSLHRVG